RRITGSSEIQILKQVLFTAGSAVIPAQARPILDEIVRLLMVNPQIQRLHVEGHTDNREKNPTDLADLRARGVIKYLTEHGVDASRLTAESYGPLRPVADNATEDGRAKNRRVEFHIEEAPPAKPTAGPPPGGPGPAADMEKMARIAGSAVPRAAASTLRYDITHPVTLPKMSTTMVTIVNEYVPGEDILLFRPEGNVSG